MIFFLYKTHNVPELILLFALNILQIFEVPIILKLVYTHPLIISENFP